jgi:methylglutamate dehydrogenase subunit B
MRILCPHCGERPLDEFSYLGDATLRRPAEDAGIEAWHEYVYQRDNPCGPHHEYWHHVGGCRAWLVVYRDTLSHEIFEVLTATEWRGRTP